MPRVYPPYLPPKEDHAPKYTLILDLDETLIHFSDGSWSHENEKNFNKQEFPEEPCFFVRPGLNAFLTQLSQYYEMIIFTAAMRDYASYFVEQIDHKKVFTHMLCREHCQKNDDGSAIKDLRLVGRDLNTTLIIDNIAENFCFTTPNHGIECSDFTGGFEDTELTVLKDFLLKMAQNDVPDVSKVISQYRDKYETY